jgi:hypothetical protein
LEPIKSIAVPATRKRAPGKPKRAGHPDALPENRIGGSVGPERRQLTPPRPTQHHLYRIGQRLRMLGGGNRWARAESLCKVTALLPHEAGPFLYRVRSESENYERVVAEADLTPEL